MHPTSSASSGQARGRLFQGPMGWVLRLLLGVASVIFLISALIAGTILGTVLIVWSLVRGKRPTVGLFTNQFERARRRGTVTPSVGEIIDVDVREVPGPGPGR